MRVLKIWSVLPLLLVAACSQPSDPALKVGFIGPLSGDAASFGIRMKNAAQLALTEADLPVPIELVALDDAMEVARGVQALQDLNADPGVVAIIAAGRSQVVAAEVSYSSAESAVLISPTATSPSLSDSGPLFFRVIPSDAAQGAFIAHAAIERGFRRLAVVFLLDDYGNGLRKEFRRIFEQQDQHRIVFEEGFPKGQTEFSPLALTVLQANPDAVFIAGMPQEIADFLIDVRKLTGSTEVQFFAPEVFLSPDSVQRAGEAAEGILVSGTEINLDPSFLARYRERFTRGNPDQEPDAFAANAYDAARAIVAAVANGARTRDQVLNELQAPTFQFSGAGGLVAFDSNGDIDTKSYGLYLVRHGNFVKVD